MSNQVYFTSDTHYGHSNVIKYCTRPFATTEEMDETMIANWNAVVRPGDLVYHIGDFALCDAERATRIAKRLMGNKYLVWGNHDKKLRKVPAFCSQFIWQKDLTQVEVGDQKITLCHYAMLTWNQSHRSAWQLHGHSHGSMPDDPGALRLDVGVDCWDYQPVAYETLVKRMGQKTYVPIDHHRDI